jgi:C-terminal processing protease CtpA/Prc
VVGEPTAGGGRNNTFVNLGSGLWASVTYTRVSDPRTGREWEGRGVQPDLRVPSNEALEAAHAHALKRLGRSP